MLKNICAYIYKKQTKPKYKDERYIRVQTSIIRPKMTHRTDMRIDRIR